MVNAYTLTFAGFLLLGGRAADLLGRRRIFVVGLLLFALASLAGGLSTTQGMLTVGARCRVSTLSAPPPSAPAPPPAPC